MRKNYIPHRIYYAGLNLRPILPDKIIEAYEKAIEKYGSYKKARSYGRYNNKRFNLIFKIFFNNYIKTHEITEYDYEKK